MGGKLEKYIQNEILLELPKLGVTGFRSNVGEAWTGNEIIELPNGDVLIRNARRFKTGLPKGFSDTFGIIHGTGQFLAMEVKRPGKKPTTPQQNFIDHVIRCGGVAGVARSVEDVRNIIGGG